ncbi:MAG TPA: aspartyl/asparaginyl beta-hydroxylase domain-containing protein [Blastocatellia bacterium]|nr:aspartyl/asparaginyl beta-hydroxylase domain-containing protein [Blastocatellia bacterium]
MLISFKLPFCFDPEPMRRDLGQIAPSAWVPHFNTGYYEGDWSGIALRSVGGAESQLYPDPLAEFADTAVLAGCPNIQNALAAFDCPLESVRLLRLGPGSVIREHTDLNLSFEDGTMRVHIPLATNEKVDFCVNYEKLVMIPGEAWYINFNLPHSVVNRGDTDRIHLVLDCVVNEWLSAVIPPEARRQYDDRIIDAEQTEETRASFDSFRRIVLDDESLLDKLRRRTNKRAFVTLAVHMGREQGFSFTPGDVEDALREGRRAWLERWI